MSNFMTLPESNGANVPKDSHSYRTVAYFVGAGLTLACRTSGVQGMALSPIHCSKDESASSSLPFYKQRNDNTLETC